MIRMIKSMNICFKLFFLFSNCFTFIASLRSFIGFLLGVAFGFGFAFLTDILCKDLLDLVGFHLLDDGRDFRDTQVYETLDVHVVGSQDDLEDDLVYPPLLSCLFKTIDERNVPGTCDPELLYFVVQLDVDLRYITGFDRLHDRSGNLALVMKEILTDVLENISGDVFDLNLSRGFISLSNMRDE